MSRQSSGRRQKSPAAAAAASDPVERVGDQRLSDLLNECQALDDNKSQFQNVVNSQDLQQSIYRALQRPLQRDIEDTSGLQQLCQFLLKLYRSTFSQRAVKNTFIPTSTANEMLRNRVVALQYLPHFIYLHLWMRSQRKASQFKFVDAFLLAIFNTEVSETQSLRTLSSGVPSNPLVRPQTVKVPPLATSSVYHDSSRLESEDKLDQRDRPSGLCFNFESVSYVEALNVSTRTQVFKLLLQAFNRHLIEVSKFGLDQFVRATLRLLEVGYVGGGQKQKQKSTRISLDSPILQELLFGAYICMYNGFQVAGNQIVDMIHARASVSGCAEVLLLSNAIKNLVLNSSPSQVSTSHVSTPLQMAKNMITNASFRAKKMQTDIPKVHVEDEHAVVAPASPLPKTVMMGAIVEEESSLLSKDNEEKTPSKSESKGFNRDKLMAKLRKKTLSISEEASGLELRARGSLEKKDKKQQKKHKAALEAAMERPDKLEVVGEATPLVAPPSNGETASAASNSSYDTVEKVEELIQMRKLPPETITIHSPESGTTIF